MSNKNELRKTMLAKAKQNRIKRVQSKANKYSGGKLNSSDKAYISGDYNKTASNRAWYYNTHDGYQGYTNFTGGREKSRYQKLLKGENPYKVKYVRTNTTHYVPPGKRADGSTYNGFYTKNRLLKDGEYSNFIKYKTFNKDVIKQKNEQAEKVNKYAILSSHKLNPKNFLDNLNTYTLDGLRTARNKGGGFEYIKGGLKDFIVDPAVDFLKGVDAVESSLLNGIAGGLETNKQLLDSILMPGNRINNIKKNVNWMQSIDNMRDSLKASNKTGWGNSVGVSLKNFRDRQRDREVQLLRNAGMNEQANKYLSDRLKTEGYENTALMIAGFVGDIANPINIGGKIIDGVKGGKKIFKKVPEGYLRNTDDIPEFVLDDIATSVKPGEEAKNARMKWVYEQADKYRKNNISKNVDEVTGEILPTTKVNNYYDGVLNNVEEVVERTPKKHKENVLDILTESKPMHDMKLYNDDALKLEREMELGYRNAIDNDIERVVEPVKNIPHKIKDVEIETMLDNIDSKSYFNYNDKLDEYLDTLSDNDFDYVMDYLQKNHPDIYNSYMKSADNADNIADDAITLERMKDKQSENLAREITKQKIKPVSSQWDMNEKEYFATKNALDVLDKITSGGKISNVTPTLSTRKKILSDTLNKYIGDLKDGTLNVRAISYITNRLKNAKIPTETKIEFINNRLFNGQKLIPNNMSERNINEFLGQLQEIHKVVDDYTQYNRINAKGNIDFNQFPESLQKFLHNFELENAKGDISDYSSYVDKLTGDITDKINKNSRGLVDLRYNEKASYLAHKFGYENFKNEIKIPLDKIEERIKALDKQPYTGKVKIEKDALIARKKELLEVSKARGAEADVIRHMNPTEFDNYYPKHLPEGVDIKVRPTKKFKQNNKINLVDDFDDAVKESVENVSKYNRENAIKSNKNVDFKILRDEVKKAVKKEHPEYENFFGTKEYNNYINKRTQLEQFYNTKSEVSYESKNKILNRDTFRNGNSSNKALVKRENVKLNDGSIGYKNIYEDGSITISDKEGTYEIPEYISKLQDEVSTYDNIYNNFVESNKLADYFHLSKPVYKTSKIKYNKNIKPIQIPEVQQNLFSLGELVDKEADLYLHYRLKYEDMKDTILNLKQEYLKAIMSYGVKDVSNIKARANERLMDIIKSEDDVFIKMDLQLLANKNKQVIEQIYESAFPGGNVSKPLDNIIDEFEDPLEIIENVNKPNTPLDNVDKPNTPHTSLDNVNKPNDKPNTPLDNINPNSKPNDKPNPNNNKPKPEPKPEPTSNTPHQNNKPEPHTNNNNKPNNSKPIPDILKFFTEKTDSNVNKKMGYEKTKLYDLYKRWLNTWKKGVTVYNPGWHVQNYLQNKGQNYLALGMDAFSNQKQARQMLDYLRGEGSVVDDIVTKEGKTLSGVDLADFASKNGVAESAQATNILAEPRTIIPPLDKAIDNSKLMHKLSRSEETARLHHYIKQIERGMTPEDAVKSVNKYLFDYDKKSKFDRVMQDFVDPFWIFHKNQARLLTTSVLENPSRTANINRARRGLEQAVPDEDKNSNFSAENGKYQSPSGSFTDSKNKDRYDYMFQENIMPYFMNAIPKDGQDLQNKMNPLLKLAVQLKNNEGDFGAKVVEGDKAGYNELTKDERKWEMLRDVNPFVNNLVTTAYNANKVYERKQSKETSNLQALELWLKYITGVKGKHEHNISWSNKYTNKQ